MQKPGSSKRGRQVHPLLIHVNECESYTPGELNTVSKIVEEKEAISIDVVPRVTANENGKERIHAQWQEFVNETTFHGIKYVFITKRQRVRRFIWLVLVLAAISLFTYQVVDRTTDFLDYQSTVNIKLVYKMSLDFPAVTICNLNSFRLTETTKLGLYYHINDIYSNLSFDANPPSERVNASDPEKILRTTAHQAEDLFVRCVWKGKPCNISEAVKPRFTRLGLCYTFSIDNDSAQVTQSGAGFGLSLIMNIESYEYMKGPEDQVGIKVLLHNANEEPLVKDLGFAVAPGTHTLIGIKQTRVSHLPKPYGECRQDVTHTSNCMFQSRAQNIASECHCREPFLTSSVIAVIIVLIKGPECALVQTFNGKVLILTEKQDDMAPCNMTQTFKCVLREWFFMNQEDVRNICPVPCNRITYDPVLSYAHLSKISRNRIYKEKISSARDPYIHAKEVARRVDPGVARDDRRVISAIKEKVISYQKSVSRFLGYMEKKFLFNRTRMFWNIRISYNYLVAELNRRLYERRPIFNAGSHVRSMLINLKHILGRRNGLLTSGCPNRHTKQKVTIVPGSKPKHSSGCSGLSPTDTISIQILKQKLQYIGMLLNNMSRFIDAQGRLFRRKGGWEDDNAHVTCLDKRLDLHGSWEANLTRAVHACELLLQPWPFNFTTKNKSISNLNAFSKWITSDITAASDFGDYGKTTCSESKPETFLQLLAIYKKIEKPYQAVFSLSHKIKYSYDNLHSCLMGSFQSLGKGIELFHRLLESYQEGNEVNTKENGTFYSRLLVESVRGISQSHEKCINSALEYTKKLQDVGNNMRNITGVFKDFDQFIPFRRRLSQIFNYGPNLPSGGMAGKRLLANGNRWIELWYTPMVTEGNKFISKFPDMKKFMDQIRRQMEVLAYANLVDDGKFFSDNFIKMDIFYRSLSYEEITQQRAFEFLSLLSEIGGFLGLLLGASVLTVFELLDYLAVMALDKWKATSGFNSLGN